MFGFSAARAAAEIAIRARSEACRGIAVPIRIQRRKPSAEAIKKVFNNRM
jgi:hypothetical protein